MDAPQLQSELVTLVTPQNQQQIVDRSSSVEPIVAGVALAFCHQGKDEIDVKEIAAEVNRLLVARGETIQLSPEKVGHKLKKVGLLTRRWSQVGNGLILDQGTRIHIHEVAKAYCGRIRHRILKTSIARYARRMNALRTVCKKWRIASISNRSRVLGSVPR